MSPAPPSPPSPPIHRRVAFAWTMALVGAAVSGGVGYVAGMQRSASPAPPPAATLAPAPPSASAQSPDDLMAQLAAGPCKGNLICDWTLTVPSPPAVDGVVMEVEGAKITGYPPYRVSLTGRVRVEGDLGIDELSVGATLVDAAGEPVGAGDVDFQSVYEPRLLRGDSGTLFASIVVRAAPTALVWKAVRQRATPSPPRPAGKEVTLAIEDPPPGMDLVGRLRSRTYESLHVSGVLEVENRGSRTLTELTIAARSATMKQKVTSVQVARELDPPLRPGERRVVKFDYFDAEEDSGADVFTVTLLR